MKEFTYSDSYKLQHENIFLLNANSTISLIEVVLFYYAKKKWNLLKYNIIDYLRGFSQKELPYNMVKVSDTG